MIINTSISFRYVLSYQGAFSLTTLYGIDQPIGVSHADDLIYLFDPVFGIELPLPPNDKALRELMVDAWTNFAINGTPGISWTPLKADSENNFLNISGTEPFMTTSQEIQARMDLWRHL